MKRLSLKLKETFDDQDEQNTKKIKLDTEISLNKIDDTLLLKNINLNRLKSDFFNQNCIQLSKSLLGKYLIRKVKTTTGEEKCLIGKIVECEAYLGGDDKASHTYNNKRTERVEAMYMKPGTLYVYIIYGMYSCLNISSKEAGAGVLIRALEPIHGTDLLKQNRELTQKQKDIANGPCKLCIAFNITKNEFNKQDLETSDSIWLQDSIESVKRSEDFKIVKAKRVGIDNAGEEAVNQLYRFYIKDNKFVSKKSKQEIEETL